MRTATIVCLILASLLVILTRLASYWLGYSEIHQALLASDPFIFLFCESVVFLVLIIFFFLAWFTKRNRKFLLVSLFSFWPLVILTFLLIDSSCGSANFFVLRGLRDRITHDYTLEDLRDFAKDVNQTGILRKAEKGWIDNHDSSNLTPLENQAVDQIRKKYPFMLWLDIGSYTHGPCILQRGDDEIVNFEWGGALQGHWGCSITTDKSRNEPYSNKDLVIIRLSDDIYLYYGD
jgi:hypothetical protein